ncbi:MAG: hypothetical protein ACYDBB_11350 [Armatimonadota bacterium]
MSFHVSRRQHMLIAALIWILVGAMITVRGILWVLADDHTHRLLAIIIPLAVILGIIKGVALLSKSASRVTARIHTLEERSPVWKIYSPSMYLLVGGMMGLGVACRWAGPHLHIVGIIGALYLVVGIALIAGSRTYWQARRV